VTVSLITLASPCAHPPSIRIQQLYPSWKTTAPPHSLDPAETSSTRENYAGLLALLGSDVSNPEDGGPPSAGADDGGDGAGRAAGTGEVTGIGAAAAGGTSFSCLCRSTSGTEARRQMCGCRHRHGVAEAGTAVPRVFPPAAIPTADTPPS